MSHRCCDNSTVVDMKCDRTYGLFLREMTSPLYGKEGKSHLCSCACAYLVVIPIFYISYTVCNTDGMTVYKPRVIWVQPTVGHRRRGVLAFNVQTACMCVVYVCVHVCVKEDT